MQRRHQKVVEIAPAPNLDPELRERMCAHAVAFAREIGYVNAGTVEFLLAPDGRYVFIEMNPRIQVEHTVTEEVTDVDLVSTQLRIAAGETLPELGLTQDAIRLRGAALQCRITTEDPANGFRPDTGRITVYRSAGGAGVRLDGGTVFVGAEIGAHFDSMLVKLTCRGADFATAVRRARRALAEFRIRGVSTNIPFLQSLLDQPDFVAGRLSTSFIDERPELLTSRTPADRGTKLLTYLAEVTVNQPYGPQRTTISPRSKLPAADLDAPPQPGARDLLLAGRPGEVRRLAAPAGGGRGHRHDVPRRPPVAAGHAGAHPRPAPRRRPRRAPDPAAAQRGGVGRGDVRRGAALPRRGPLGAARRAARGHAQPAAADAAARAQHRRLHAVPDCGHRRVRDRGRAHRHRHLPHLRRAQRRRPDAPGDRRGPRDRHRRRRGLRSATPATCSTRTSGSTRSTTTCDLAEQVVAAGAHVIAIKDMAGLLRAPAAARLVAALRERFDLPVHLHTHDTAGGQLATLLAAIDAGVDAVDVASASMSGTTSQPSMSALVAATDGTEHATGLDLQAVCDLEPYWEGVRQLYAPFESGLASPTGRVYTHEIPGGQLSNLRQQAIALGLGDRFESIEDMYAAANRILGNIVKVTPSSKVVGDLALALVGANADPAEFEADPTRFDIPDSVIGFLNGDLGDPPGGWPEPFRSKALEGRTRKPRGQRAVGAGGGRPRVGAPAHAQPAAVPRPDPGLRGVARDLLRPVRARDGRVPARPGRGHRARGRPRARQAAAARRPVGQ